MSTDTVATLPRLDTLAAIAPRLGCEVWELLHPEIKTVRERLRSYEIVEQAMRQPRKPGVST